MAGAVAVLLKNDAACLLECLVGKQLMNLGFWNYYARDETTERKKLTTLRLLAAYYFQ